MVRASSPPAPTPAPRSPPPHPSPPPAHGAEAPAKGGRPGLPPAGAVRQREAEKQKEDEERATQLKAGEAARRGGTGRKTEKTQRW